MALRSHPILFNPHISVPVSFSWQNSTYPSKTGPDVTSSVKPSLTLGRVTCSFNSQQHFARNEWAQFCSTSILVNENVRPREHVISPGSHSWAMTEAKVNWGLGLLVQGDFLCVYKLLFGVYSGMSSGQFFFSLTFLVNPGGSSRAHLKWGPLFLLS